MLIVLQHWELLLTGPTPPGGMAYHATDTLTGGLNLYRESYPTRSGMLQSRTVVVTLYVGRIGRTQLEDATRDSVTGLMKKEALPPGERRWTCRVWVMVVLAKAISMRFMKPPDELGKFVATKLNLY